MTKCRWCDTLHGPTCPTVKSIEYFDDGVTVKKVEFKTAADYPMPVSWPTLPPAVPYAPYIQPLVATVFRCRTEAKTHEKHR